MLSRVTDEENEKKTLVPLFEKTTPLSNPHLATILIRYELLVDFYFAFRADFKGFI